MANGSIANNRHLQILDALYTAGNVTVNALEELLQVSKVTIRRDLDFLNDKGLLVRTHGGASLPPNQDIRLNDEDYAKKDIVHVQEKRRIAQKCASLINTQDILFINSGTTTNLLLQSIAGKQIKVITNNAASLESPIDEKVEILFLGESTSSIPVRSSGSSPSPPFARCTAPTPSWAPMASAWKKGSPPQSTRSAASTRP